VKGITAARMWRVVVMFLTSLAALGALSSTVLAFQDDERAGQAMGLAFMGAFMLVFLIFFAVIYVYIALCLSTIAKKTNTPDIWMAWIPIIQGVLMLKIADKPLWWILLLLIPLVNVVIGIIVWMEIARRRNKPEWWGILLIVPLVGIIVPGYLAYSD
jgi:Family of unknown function (DUF5684)